MDANQASTLLLSKPSALEMEFRQALGQPKDGVIGLVDDLLRLCRQNAVHLSWRNDCCRLRSAGMSEIVIEQPLRRPVFRAILARLAAMCNQRLPKSVSPFGGDGELFAENVPSAALHFSFVNTPDEQWLELTPLLGESRM